MSTLQLSRLPEKRNDTALGSVRCKQHREQLDANLARMNAGLFGPADAVQPGAKNPRGFVYLLALADGTAFNIGSCRNPLQCLHSLASRFHERFDLAASIVVQTRSYDEASALESRLQHMFAHGGTVCPSWLTRAEDVQSRWFSPTHFADAQQHLASASLSLTGAINSAAQIIAADLIEHRKTIEDWAFSAAKHLNAEVAYAPGARQLQLARALRDWLDIFRHLHVPLFAEQSEQSSFVCQMARLYGSTLMARF